MAPTVAPRAGVDEVNRVHAALRSLLPSMFGADAILEPYHQIDAAQNVGAVATSATPAG